MWPPDGGAGKHCTKVSRGVSILKGGILGALAAEIPSEDVGIDVPEFATLGEEDLPIEAAAAAPAGIEAAAEAPGPGNDHGVPVAVLDRPIPVPPAVPVGGCLLKMPKCFPIRGSIYYTEDIGPVPQLSAGLANTKVWTSSMRVYVFQTGALGGH